MKVIEKGPTHSLTLEQLYTPRKRVDKVYLGQDVPCEGRVCIEDGSRETVLQTMNDYIRDFALPIQYDTEVTSIRRREDGRFQVDTAGMDTYLARTVVVAIGVFGRPNRPDYPLPGSLKRNVHFDLTQPLPEGESILVVGGGNTALEYVDFLHRKHPVVLAYRGNVFARANEVNRRILEEIQGRGLAEVWMQADIRMVLDTGVAPRVQAIFKDGRSLCTDHVVYAIGGSTPLGFLQQAGIQLDGKHAVVDHRGETNQRGLYLAGDLVAGGKGTLVKAFNSGHRVVWGGLCQSHFSCHPPS
ncbi:pyridine nucleotide-disulfide oxidoreductase [Geothrix limicola]|uniref:Pyridine nucleotide-disulfide oxidoreductase n=2 Tax=Geothrix limicola TaxID=2927978 RepID=A0ABQ5QHD0_9BACT|nr:pyridine nucleotide-disulfide oxidoreductase [Geothrix limicola]